MEEKLIKIYIYRGLVEDVTGLPDGYLYEVIDKDIQEEEGKNSCDKCGIIEESLKLIWLTAEDFKPLQKDNVTEERIQEIIKKGYDALCEKCYQEEIKEPKEVLISNADEKQAVIDTMKVIDEATKKIIFSLERDTGLKQML